jgi:hypothetical protein
MLAISVRVRKAMLSGRMDCSITHVRHSRRGKARDVREACYSLGVGVAALCITAYSYLAGLESRVLAIGAADTLSGSCAA